MNGIVMLEFMATTIALIGSALVALKKKEGFIFFVISNLLWIIFDARNLHFWQGFMFICFTGTAIYGWYNWRDPSYNSDLTELYEESNEKIKTGRNIQTWDEVLRQVDTEQIGQDQVPLALKGDHPCINCSDGLTDGERCINEELCIAWEIYLEAHDE